ncbi:MAG: right-handed parallel beta-helix repeat-containing protein [Candidatus Pacearchaeota archaeon]
MKKRAVSQVIATVLIILITIAAISILWLVVLPMLKDLSSFEAMVSLEIVSSGYTAWDSENRLAEIQIKRGVDEAKIAGFRLIFEMENDNLYYRSEEIISLNEKKVYNFNFTNYSSYGELLVVKLIAVYEGGSESGVLSELVIEKIPKKDLSTKNPSGGYISPSTSGSGGSSGGTGECDLTTTYWNTSSATKESFVRLIVEGSNCQNELINYVIIKQGELSWNPFNWFNQIVFVGISSTSMNWVAGQRQDGVIQTGTYHFEAELSNQGSEEVVSGNLVVTDETCVPSCSGKECGDDGCGGTCPPGCGVSEECDSNGQCVILECTNDAGCSSAGSFCEGNTPYTCILGSDGCLDRTNGQTCSSGEICVNGQCVVQGSGDIFYVSLTGAGSHTGTVGNEFSMSEAISYADSHLNEMITFLLKGGNYGGVGFSSNINRLGWDRKVVYKAESSSNPPVFTGIGFSRDIHRYAEFDGLHVVHGGTTASHLILIRDSDNLHFKNMYLEGNGEDNFPRSSWDYSGIITRRDISDNNDREEIVVENCEITGVIRGVGIDGGYKKGIIIRNNYFHHIAESGMAIEGIKDDVVLIEGNEVYYQTIGGDFHGSSIEVRGQPFVIRNNIFHGFGRSSALMFYDRTYEEIGYSNMIVEGNLIYDSVNINTVWLSDMGHNFTFRNNTIIGRWRENPPQTNSWRYSGGVNLYFATNSDKNSIYFYDNIVAGMISGDLASINEDRNIIYSVWAGSSAGGWLGESDLNSNSKILTDTNGATSDPDYFENSEEFFIGGDLFDTYSFQYPSTGASGDYGSPHRINLTSAYHPMMSSSACDGSVNGKPGVAVGALSCKN